MPTKGTLLIHSVSFSESNVYIWEELEGDKKWQQ